MLVILRGEEKRSAALKKGAVGKSAPKVAQVF